MGSFKILSISRVLDSKQQGQGMTEYIIIVALFAVAAIGAYSYFGQILRNQTAGMAAEMAGKDSTTNVNAAQTATGQAATSADKTKSLSSHGSAKDLSGK